MPLLEPAGRVALITGGASGIGYGIAEAAAALGMKLVLADVDAGRLQDAQRQLSANGADVLTLSFDVSDAQAWRLALDRVLERFGALHLLCNNAGITGTGRRIEQLDAAEWARILNVNLTGMFLGTQAVLPHLHRQRQGGHIVNTASMGALLPYAGGASYVTSKAGMLAFSEVLRQELADSDIGVSVLLPAQVRTRLFDTSSQQLAPDEIDAMHRRASAVASLQRDGLDAGAVGRQVMNAVQDNRFHIFTHPELSAAVRQRQDAVMADFDTLDGQSPSV